MWWQDKGYNLLQHGDRYERLWWPLLKNDFPEYERFWVSHIIPVTNRIDATIAQSGPKWTGFRDDPHISDDLEVMARAHYSSFYFLARANLLVTCEPHIYFEDAFSLLAAATENANRFVKVWQRGLTQDLNLTKSPLYGIDVLSWPAVKGIDDYRNVLLHGPVLGRAHYLNSEFLPKREHLPKRDHGGRGRRSKPDGGWRALQKLAHADFVEGRCLLAGLKAELLRNLRSAWEVICEIADQASLKKEYRDLYDLDEQYCIRGGSERAEGASAKEPTLDLSSPPASGFVQVRASPTVRDIIFGHPPVKPKP